MLRLSRFLRALPSTCAVLVAGAAALTSGQTAFAKTSVFGASSSSPVRERTEYRSTDGFVRVGIPPLSADDQKQLKGGFTNLLGATTPSSQGWRLIQVATTVSYYFKSATYSVNEGGGSINLTISRTGNTGTGTVSYATANGTATSDADYGATSGVASFGQGQTEYTISVPIKQDAPPVVEGAKTFVVNLTTPTSTVNGVTASVGTPAQATVQINDDDSAVQFDSNVATVGESDGKVTLTVRRRTGLNNSSSTDIALAKPVKVTVTTTDGTANSGPDQPDFTAQNTVVTIPAGQVTTTVDIPIIPDTLDEADETFTVTLSNPDSPQTTLLDPISKTTVTITDDDDTTVSIEKPTYSVNEGDGTVRVNVVRTGSTNDTSKPLSVSYTTSSGSATGDVDYTTTSGTLKFDSNVTSLPVDIPITRDTIAEDNETFSFRLSNASVDGTPVSSDKITPYSTATITIVDDDPAFNFDNTAPSVNESATSVTVNVVRTLGINTLATVNYATADGTATAGSDYTANSGTLTFQPGVSSLPVTVQLTDDLGDEADETFTITLTSATNGFSPGPRATATVTIIDNDDTPTITIANVSAREGNLVDGKTQQRFVVKLSAPSLLNVSVRYHTEDGTATIADNDYTATSGILIIKAGDTTGDIFVPIIDDKKFEDNEGYILELTNPSNGILATPRATGFIVNVTSDQDLDGDGKPDGINDDDPPTSVFSFVNTSVSVSESAPRATLTVKRSGDTRTAATVTLTTKDGTALAGSDYTATTTTLSFAATSNSADQQQNVTIPILDDTVNEATEDFTATLSNAKGTRSTATIGNGPATISILDNDPVPSLTVNSPRVTEGDSGTTNLVFTATLSTASDQTITLNYSTADGTAQAGSDYVATSGTLTFAPRVTTQTITVPVITDTLTETPAEETVLLNLDTPQNVTLKTTQATGTIVDDDTPILVGALSFSSDSTDPTVRETAKEVVLTVTRSQGEDRAATVDYKTANGSATAGSDYTATSGKLTLGVGKTSATISVPILDDTLKEDNETFSLTLSNPSSNVTLPNQPTTTITIADDEGAPTLSIADTQIVEGDSGTTSLLFTVSLQPQSQTAVSVQAATTTGGSASAAAGPDSPQDFRANRATLTFAPGQSTKTFPVTVLSDTRVESDETVIVELSNATGAPLGQSKATGTIINDDQPGGGGTISFLASSSSVSESAGTATISLGRTGNVDMINQQGASVRVTSGQGTATNGQDYRAINSIITFAAGQTVKSFTIPIINDKVHEQNETVPLTLSSPSDNAILGTITRATLTINDDDPSTLR